MGKVDRLRNRVNPFTALFWALGNVLTNIGPCPPGRCHSTAVHKACPYMVIIGSILNEDALPPPLSRYIIYLWLDCEVRIANVELECRGRPDGKCLELLNCRGAELTSSTLTCHSRGTDQAPYPTRYLIH